MAAWPRTRPSCQRATLATGSHVVVRVTRTPPRGWGCALTGMGNAASDALRKADAELRDAANPGNSVSLTERQLAIIPPAVFELPAYKGLTSLNVSRNAIATIPNELERLTALTSLFGNTNNISRLPSAVGSLRNLTTLSLQRNRLTDLTPLTDVPSLTELELQENMLEALPDSLARLTNLRYLNLNKNRLRSLPTSICSITTLQAINVTDNQVGHRCGLLVTRF